ncbi:MAG: YcxB family protein, partial [Chitinophagaceae bacterium]
PITVYRRAATFRDHFIMDFGGESFSVGNERGSRSWQWTALSKWIETPNFFHLYFDSRSFFLVPKYAFSGSDDLHEMRNLLRQKIEK